MMTTEVFDLGDRVACDWCNKDWTNDNTSGGFLFGSKATCPDCAPGFYAKVKKSGELHFIRATCPTGMSFADWVRKILRDGKPGQITVTSL